MEIISKLTGHTDKVNCIVLTKSKNYLFSSSNDKRIIQWDLIKSSYKTLYERTSSAYSLAVCNKSSYLASSCKDDEIIIYNIEPNQEDKIVINTKQSVLCLVFTPNCQYLICGDLEKNVSLFKYKTWEKIREFKGHEDQISYMSVSNNSRVLVTCSYDQCIKIWDLMGVEDDWEAKELYRLEGHAGLVNGVVFSRDNKVIYSVCEERKVGIWRMENVPVCGREDGMKKGGFMCAGVAAAVFAGVLVYKVMRKKK
jgi:WD40 repeat protein